MYNYSEWYIIGYEECRRGYLYLAERSHLNHLVPEYFAQVDNIPDWNSAKKVPYPPNYWHMTGARYAIEVWHQDFAALQVPYWETLPEMMLLGNSEYCMYCGKAGDECYSDVLVDVLACSEECARRYRQLVYQEPSPQHLINGYRYNPLPVDPLKLKQYIEGLPDYRCPEQVSHRPIVTRPIQVPKLQLELSTGNFPNIPGLTLE